MAKSAPVNAFSLELTKEQLELVLKALSPFKTDDNIRFSIVEDNVIFEAEDLGNTAKITVGTADIPSDVIGTGIFLSKAVLQKIFENMDGVIKLHFVKKGDEWSEIEVNISGDHINIGLPIYTKELNTDYKPEKGATAILNAEVFGNIITRTEVAMLRNSHILGSIDMAKTYVCGSSTCISIYKELFNNDLELHISPSFKPYMANLPRLGESIEVIKADEGKVVFKVGPVEYKTYSVAHRIPDPEAELQGSRVKFRAGLGNLRKACARLSIPLIANTSLYLSVQGNNLNLKVYDVQNRVSESNIQLSSVEGEDAEIQVPLFEFADIIKVHNDDAVISFEVADDILAALKVDDDKQTTVLASTIIE